MIIAVDFDGTVVTHKFPYVGEDVGAADVLKNLVKNGHKLILNTMRSHRPYEFPDGTSKDTLQEAIDWFESNSIELYGVNENPSQKEWTDSPKIYANIYIDDAALGCPKIMSKHGVPIVDWLTIDNWFKQVGIINTII